MKVLIPARTGSTRLPNKNWIPFADKKSLFDVKAEQLLIAGISPCDVYVNCEDEGKRVQVEQYGFNFQLRDAFHCTKEGERAILQYLLKGLPPSDNENDDVLFLQLTDPFFNAFARFLQTWKLVKARGQHDSMMAVRPCTDQLIYPDGTPANFDFFGQATQCLKQWYTISMCAIIADRQTMLACNHYIGKSPYLFVTNAINSDIDTLADFELAQQLWQNNNK